MAEISEQEFLRNYDITIFDRPSVAADIAAFTIRNEQTDNYRRNEKSKLSLLLIKRGEHPFKDHWALPGGFLKRGESLEECAARVTVEKAGIKPISVMPSGVYSSPERDPRGWIISNAFISIITSGSENVKGGDDAADAKWFDVDFSKNDDGSYELILSSGDIRLCAVLKEASSSFGITRYEIVNNGTLAFDHASIIAASLTKLRDHTGNFDVVFDFLPKVFTLSQLQCVQETILNVSLLPANFRRKAFDFVEPTNEYFNGAGHRPAQLFKKK